MSKKLYIGEVKETWSAWPNESQTETYVDWEVEPPVGTKVYGCSDQQPSLFRWEQYIDWSDPHPNGVLMESIYDPRLITDGEFGKPDFDNPNIVRNFRAYFEHPIPKKHFTVDEIWNNDKLMALNATMGLSMEQIVEFFNIAKEIIQEE